MLDKRRKLRRELWFLIQLLEVKLRNMKYWQVRIENKVPVIYRSAMSWKVRKDVSKMRDIMLNITCKIKINRNSYSVW